MTEVPPCRLLPNRHAKSTGDASEEFAPTVPLIMDVASHLRDSLTLRYSTTSCSKFAAPCTTIWACRFPGIQLRFNDNLPPESCNILLSEVPVSQGKLRPGISWCAKAPRTLMRSGGFTL